MKTCLIAPRPGTRNLKQNRIGRPSIPGISASTAAFLVAVASFVSALAFHSEDPTRRSAPRFTVYGVLEIDLFLGADDRSFELTLKNEVGRIVRTATVIGRRTEYRFSGLTMGEYTLALQDGFHELGRLQFVVSEFGQSEIRKDLVVVPREPARGVDVAAVGLVYARPALNQQLWREAAQLAERGDSRGVVERLERMTDDDPDDFEAWTELGTAHSKLNQSKQAEASLLRATEAQPDFFPAWLNLGKLRFNAKNFPAAIEALTRAVRLRPFSAISHYLLGECYLSIRLGSKAVPHLEKAIRLDPQAMAGAHIRLAQLYDRAGLKGRAAREYLEFLAKKPDAADRQAIQRYVERHGRP